MKLADRLAKIVGSWRFITVQSLFLLAYILANTVLPTEYHFDPYPFVFLNLLLSFQAAYTAPILMISQNRMADMDREMAQHDHQSTEAILRSIRKLEKKLLDKMEDIEEEVKDD